MILTGGYSPRVILVEQQGELRGLITIKDILKTIIAHEQTEHPEGSFLDAELEETLEEATEWIREKTNFIAGKLGLRRSARGSGIELPQSDSIGLNERPPRTVVFDAAADETPSRPNSRLGNPFAMRSR